MKKEQAYCCFNCDNLGGGMYKPHTEETEWFMGLTGNGQAHYACKECHVLLFNAFPVNS